MNKSFYTRTDAELYTGSNNFAARIESGYALYGLRPEQSEAYTGVNETWNAAYLAAVNPETRTRGKVAAKNAARAAVRAMASDLSKVIDGTPSVTDEMRIDLGLSVRRRPMPVPPPQEAPGLDVIAAVGRTVRLRLHEAGGNRRGRAPGTTGASVWSYVGPVPPVGIDGWRFEGTHNKTVVDVPFSADVPNGAVVWFTAFWVGSRLESGPSCNPVAVNLPGGVARAAA